jgi:uncharacterized LabA/DUF88 family protein
MNESIKAILESIPSDEIDQDDADDGMNGLEIKRKFRASIYVDIFTTEPDLEKAREIATKEVEEYQEQIPNSYVGGVANFNGFIPDREI